MAAALVQLPQTKCGFFFYSAWCVAVLPAQQQVLA
jgi:hypothetical protein